MKCGGRRPISRVIAAVTGNRLESRGNGQNRLLLWRICRLLRRRYVCTAILL